MTQANQDDPDHDPGDAVPPGVAPKDPPPLTAEDLAVKRKLERLGQGAPAETGGPEKPGA